MTTSTDGLVEQLRDKDAYIAGLERVLERIAYGNPGGDSCTVIAIRNVARQAMAQRIGAGW